MDHAAPSEPPEIAHELDARGLLCPLPVLRARKRMKPLAAGGVIAVLADDPSKPKKKGWWSLGR